MLKVKLIIPEHNQLIDDAVNDFLQNLDRRSKANRFAPHYNIKKTSYAFNENGVFNQAIIEYEIKE